MDENPIVEHVNAPYHRGILNNATHTQHQRNPTCGDEVTLQLLISDNRIETAWFQATGCMVSQAAASMLCEHIEGMTTQELTELSPAAFLNHIAIPLTPHRQQCALLPLYALQQMSAV